MTARVLVVDDCVELLEVICIVLESHGFHAIGASNSISALDAARGKAPDVCLIDMGLPEIDGYALAATLGACAPRAYLIGMSGPERDSERERQSGIHLAQFIYKPFTTETLLAALALAPRNLRALHVS